MHTDSVFIKKKASLTYFTTPVGTVCATMSASGVGCHLFKSQPNPRIDLLSHSLLISETLQINNLLRLNTND